MRLRVVLRYSKTDQGRASILTSSRHNNAEVCPVAAVSHLVMVRSPWQNNIFSIFPHFPVVSREHHQ